MGCSTSWGEEAHADGRLLRVLGVGFGLAVTIGGTIGMGIFRTPGEIAGMGTRYSAARIGTFSRMPNSRPT